MDWATIVTGAVGLAGIGGALLSARMSGNSNSRDLLTSISADDGRARRAEKRAMYAKFLANCTDMLRVQSRIDVYKADSPQGHLPREVDEQNALSLIAAMTANAELELIAPADVRERARELLDIIIGHRPGYGEARKQLMTAMRADLGESPDGAYRPSSPAEHALRAY
jgi:hypothetical protein